MLFALAFLFALSITFAVTPLVIFLANRFGLVDDPRTRYHPAHVHTGIIPRAGGLALAAGVLIPVILLLGFTKISVGIMIACLILVAVGLADDKKDINPYVRFFTNTVSALIIVAAGIGIPYVTNPISGGVIHLDTLRITFDFFGPHSILVWADLFALLWILWTINIVGWSAGVDGEMPGFVSISAFVLGILSFRFAISQPNQG